MKILYKSKMLNNHFATLIENLQMDYRFKYLTNRLVRDNCIAYAFTFNRYYAIIITKSNDVYILKNKNRISEYAIKEFLSKIYTCG